MSLSSAQQALLEQWRGGGGRRPPEIGIPRHHEPGPAPLSFAEERLWFLQVLEPESYAYNVAVVWKLEGPLDIAALGNSLNEIVRRHEVLRSTFRLHGNTPGRIVQPLADIPWRRLDLSALPANRREAELDNHLRRGACRPFDLDHGPCLHACLYVLGPRRHAFALNLHHAVCDAWSLGILSEELRVLYHDFSRGEAPSLAPLDLQYADFAAWQRRDLQGEKLQRLLGYWTGQLADLPGSLDLPFDRPRPGTQSYRGANLRFRLPETLAGRVRSFAQERNLTLYMVLLAAFYGFLRRWTHQTDLTVGTPVAGRSREEAEGLIGCFINTLVLRFRAPEAAWQELTMSQILDQVRKTTLDAFAHEELPFERLVDELNLERDVSKPPLFQVLFQVVNTPPLARQLGSLVFDFEEIDNDTSKLDLSLSFADGRSGIHGWCEYDSALFDATTLQRLLSGFEILLQTAIDEPDRSMAQLPMFSSAERHALRVEWNSTSRDFAEGPGGLHDLVVRQAEVTPDRFALVHGERRLTYRELLRTSAWLAGELHARGVGPEDLVGILMERPLEMPLAVLAVLRAGGAYVALDPSHPPERLALMIEDSGVELILIQEHLRTCLPDCSGIEIFAPDVLSAAAPNPNAIPPGPPTVPRQAAYLIYTSGSTGRPKGVTITHANAVVFVRWAAEVYSPAELAGVLASTSLTFDLSIFELFVPWSLGGCVILAENALHLAEVATANEVTLVNTVPSALHELLLAEALPPSVKVINVAGEPLKKELVDKAYGEPGVERVLNLYGPSESTTYATWSHVEARENRPPTIGRPVARTRAWVLDRTSQPVPIGVKGELCLAGDGLARGYHRRPARTAESFIPDPFAGKPGGRLYRTGDEVRALADGRLEFIGRRDHQVKVRGFRIELGEIETVLDAHPAVEQSLVMVRETSNGAKNLAAWVVTDDTSLADGDEGIEPLLSYLRQHLPLYMIPDAVVRLDAMPLTPNGKIDRQQLPAPGVARSNPTAPSRPLAGNLENEIGAVWREVLGGEASDRGHHFLADDSFFEVGGNSLLLVRVYTRLRETLGERLRHRRLTIPDLIRHPTLAALASFLSGGTEKPAAGPPENPQRTAKTQGRKTRLSRVRDKRIALKRARRRDP